MMGDGEVRAELLESIVVELPGVVRNNDLRNSKLTDNVLPYEILGISFCYLGERLRLYPLCNGPWSRGPSMSTPH